MKNKTTYKIAYADKVEALSKPGLIFSTQLEADDYIKKVSQESPRFHYWVEPIPETEAKATNGNA
jgi:hypothetical protein